MTIGPEPIRRILWISLRRGTERSLCGSFGGDLTVSRSAFPGKLEEI